jgi:hypothetical protein
VDPHLAHVVARALLGRDNCRSPWGLVVSKRGQYAASDFVTRGVKVSYGSTRLCATALTPQQRFLRHDASELKGASQLLAGLHTLNPYCRERLAQQMSDCVTLLG